MKSRKGLAMEASSVINIYIFVRLNNLNSIWTYFLAQKKAYSWSWVWSKSKQAYIKYIENIADFSLGH